MKEKKIFQWGKKNCLTENCFFKKIILFTKISFIELRIIINWKTFCWMFFCKTESKQFFLKQGFLCFLEIHFLQWRTRRFKLQSLEFVKLHSHVMASLRKASGLLPFCHNTTLQWHVVDTKTDNMNHESARWRSLGIWPVQWSGSCIWGTWQTWRPSLLFAGPKKKGEIKPRGPNVLPVRLAGFKRGERTMLTPFVPQKDGHSSVLSCSWEPALGQRGWSPDLYRSHSEVTERVATPKKEIRWKTWLELVRLQDFVLRVSMRSNWMWSNSKIIWCQCYIFMLKDFGSK